MPTRPFFTFNLHPLRYLPLLAASSVAFAQDAGSDEADDEVFTLDAFRVETSSMRGYTATNATSGTMLNTSLKDTPFAIDVVTPQFIEDTGSTDIREVLAYDSGVMLENTMERSDGNNFTTGVENDDRSINNNDTDVVIRGFRSPTLKNGFFTITRVDSINIGRFERASGPTSLLYGVGAISGITNVITKTPSDLNADLTRLELFSGSNGFLRATIDHNGSTGNFEPGDVNYRVNLSSQVEEDLFPFIKEEVFFVTPVVEFRPWSSTNILVDVEYAERTTEGIGSRDVEDNLFPRFTDENEPARLLENKLVNSHFVNISGPDAVRDEDYLSPRIEVTQLIGQNLSILASANYTELEQSELRPVEMSHEAIGFPDAFLASEASVQDYIDNSVINYGWGRTDNLTKDAQVRLSALYTFEFFEATHNIVFGRQERSLVTDGPAANSNWVGPDSAFVAETLDNLPLSYKGEETFAYQSRRLDNQWYQGHYLIYQGSWWQNRVVPIIGLRWDRTQTRVRAFTRSGPDEAWVQNEDFLANRGVVDGYDEVKNQETPTLGLSVAVTDDISLYGVYAEGIALANTVQRDGEGQSFAPPLTKNTEFGLKFDFFGGKISGRATYFVLEKYGGVRYSFYATNPGRGNFDPTQPIIYELTDSAKDAFEQWSGIDLQADYGIEKTRSMDGPRQVWPVPFDLLGEQLVAYARHTWDSKTSFDQWRQAPGRINFASGNNPNEDRGAYHNYDEESSGVEIRLNLRPIENWETVISYTYNEVIITTGLSNLAGGDYDYYGIHPVFYYTGGPENFDEDWRPESYTGNLGANTINNDTPEQTLRIWSKYTFTDSFLDGLEIGVGYRYQSERLADSPWLGGRDSIQDAAGADNVRAPVPAFDLWDLAITYRWIWKEKEWNLGLNIRNVFDEDLVSASAENLFADLEDGSQVPVVTRFYLPQQRNIRVSLRVSF